MVFFGKGTAGELECGENIDRHSRNDCHRHDLCGSDAQLVIGQCRVEERQQDMKAAAAQARACLGTLCGGGGRFGLIVQMVMSPWF